MEYTLPNDIKEAQSVEVFKQKVKDTYFSLYFLFLATNVLLYLFI